MMETSQVMGLVGLALATGCGVGLIIGLFIDERRKAR